MGMASSVAAGPQSLSAAMRLLTALDHSFRQLPLLPDAVRDPLVNGCYQGCEQSRGELDVFSGAAMSLLQRRSV